MLFNKTTEYAFRIFAFMAMDREKLYRADEIYEQLNIPERYLKRLLTGLSKTGLMESVQGNKGGFRLNKNPETISLLDIANATDSYQDKSLCFFGFKECRFGKTKCYMHEKWIGIIEGIENLLRSTKLSDLTDHETQKYITEKMQLLNKN
ncbi:MAG TPA: Rrf2 family transcriptional regulator [Bacteroidales bacterium]|nr:Rrf2 family transcriptional regulator [Bacteroidales bacterium]